MAQHDGVIDNQAGAATRSDLNNALAALISNNSGATAPPTTYAYQPWADTTTGLLKIRNAANSAWITIGTLASTNLGLLALSGGSMTGLLTLAAGANIASAATVDLTAATGNSPRIIGTVATSAFTMNAGQQMWLIADGAWPLTHNATTNNIVGGASITLAAGARVFVVKDLSGIIQTIPYKADGTAVVGISVATQAEMEAVTSNTVAATPLNTNWHPGVTKFHVKAGITGNILESRNVTSVTDNGTGSITVTIATDFSADTYTIMPGLRAPGTQGLTPNISAQTTGAFTCVCNEGGVAVDPVGYYFAGLGDQA